MAVVKAENFGTVDLTHSADQLDDREYPLLINFDITDKFYLKKRAGLKPWILNLGEGDVIKWDYGPLKILGRYRLNNRDLLFVTTATGENVFYIEIGDTTRRGWMSGDFWGASTGFQYNSYFWVLSERAPRNLWRTNIDTSTRHATPNIVFSSTMAFPYKERIYSIASHADETSATAIFYSAPYTLTDWMTDAAFLDQAAGFMHFGPGDGDRLVAIALLNDTIMVFKANSVYAMHASSGIEAQFSQKKLNGSIGCYSKDTMVEIEGLLYFESRHGVYRTDGITFEELSAPVKHYFDDRLGAAKQIYDLDAAVRWKNKYMLFQYSPETNTTRTLVYDIFNKSWVLYDFEGIQPYRAFYVADVQKLLISDRNSSMIFELDEDTFTDDGRAFRCSADSKLFDFDMVEGMKKCLYANVEYISAGGQPSMHWKFDSSTADTEQLLLNPGSEEGFPVQAPVRGPGYFRRLGWRFDYKGDSDMQLNAVTYDLMQKPYNKAARGMGSRMISLGQLLGSGRL